MVALLSAFWPSAVPVARGEPRSFPCRSVIALGSLFWAYVTLLDIVSADAMIIVLRERGGALVFLPWQQRLLQHVLLLPVLLGCYCLALRIGWKPLGRRLPQQPALALGFSLLVEWAMLAGEWLLHVAFGTYADMFGLFTEGDWAIWVSTTAMGLLAYGFGLALLTGIATSRRYQALALHNSDLRRKWADARLAALRTQLSPHTLFNVLHTIQARIKSEPEIAEGLIASLGDLLRGLLQAGERDFVLLREELQFVELYLGLQIGRFADRLAVRIHDGPDVPDVWVPSLILHPLVENAVVHGLANHSGQVRIDVSWSVSPEGLRLRVMNSVGSADTPGIGGFGLRNVRERLAVQFGECATLTSASDGASSWVATLHLPLLREWRFGVSTAAVERP
jgi:two-component system, LytTR family, sensor kinase